MPNTSMSSDNYEHIQITCPCCGQVYTMGKPVESELPDDLRCKPCQREDEEQERIEAEVAEQDMPDVCLHCGKVHDRISREDNPECYDALHGVRP